MPADLKPLCPAHPTNMKGDSCAGAPDKKGTHDTDCLATRAPELFQQTHAKGYQCKTKRGCEDEFLSEAECQVNLTRKELLCRCTEPDLSLPGACEGPIPLTRDKLVIDPHTGKPNCPSKLIDIGSRIVYPKKGPMTIGYMGHIPGMDVSCQAVTIPWRRKWCCVTFDRASAFRPKSAVRTRLMPERGKTRNGTPNPTADRSPTRRKRHCGEGNVWVCVKGTSGVDRSGFFFRRRKRKQRRRRLWQRRAVVTKKVEWRIER